MIPCRKGPNGQPCHRWGEGLPFDPQRHCWACHLYHTDERYRLAFDQDTTPLTEPRQPRTWTAAEMVARFLRAIATETAWRAAGHRGPLPEEKAFRRQQCNVCPERDSGNDSCKKCGCYLEAGLAPPRPLGKLDCSTQMCPLGKWNYAGGYVGRPGCCGGQSNLSDLLTIKNDPSIQTHRAS